MMSSSLAISAGWKDSPPTPIQMREPLMRAPDAGHQRQQQQSEADEQCGVREPLQHPVVAHDGQHQHEQSDADRGPGELVDRVPVRQRLALVGGLRPVREVQPVDHHQAEPVQQDDDRQDHRVRIPGEEAQREVRDERQPREDRRGGDEVAGDLVEDHVCDLRVRGTDDEQRQEHAEELGVAPRFGGHRKPAACRASWSARSRAAASSSAGIPSSSRCWVNSGRSSTSTG